MTALEVIRRGMTGLLGAAGVYLAFLNWYALLKRMTRPNGPTWIPLIGGLLGVTAILLAPSDTARRYWWLALLLDAGSIPGLGLTAVHLLVKIGDRRS